MKLSLARRRDASRACQEVKNRLTRGGQSLLGYKGLRILPSKLAGGLLTPVPTEKASRKSLQSSADFVNIAADLSVSIRSSMGQSQTKAMGARSRELTSSLPRATLVWLGGIAFLGLSAALVYSMIRQDSLEQQVGELRYRLDSIQRRPTRLSESDRVSIQNSTEKQVAEAIQSLKR